MSDLRETVAAAMHAVSPWRDQTFNGIGWNEEAGAAIEAMAQALLSDEAVEAAARASLREKYSHDVWDEVLETPVAESGIVANGIHFDTGTPEMVRAGTRAALTAALAAIGYSADCGCTSIDPGWDGADGGVVDVIQCSDPHCPRAIANASGAAG